MRSHKKLKIRYIENQLKIDFRQYRSNLSNLTEAQKCIVRLGAIKDKLRCLDVQNRKAINLFRYQHSHEKYNQKWVEKECQLMEKTHDDKYREIKELISKNKFSYKQKNHFGGNAEIYGINLVRLTSSMFKSIHA